MIMTSVSRALRHVIPWRGRRLVLAALALALPVSLLAGLLVGPVALPWPDVALALLDGLPFVEAPADLSAAERTILIQLRLPRVLLGALVGLSLALAGGVMQGVFRNPLASPYLLGIAGGASAGAAAAIALGGAAHPLSVPLAAFGGGWLAVTLVYGIARQGGRGRVSDPRTTLILAGVALGALFSALTGLWLALAQGDAMRSIVFWLLGGLTQARWNYVAWLAPVALLGGLVLWALSRELNALALGEEAAAHLGLPVAALRWLMLGVATLLTAGAVAVAGTIGFVGLVTPHMVRLLIGPDHRALLPATALAGAVFLIAADAVARTLVRPLELPVGVITALVGAPFFLYLLRAHRDHDRGLKGEMR